MWTKDPVSVSSNAPTSLEKKFAFQSGQFLKCSPQAKLLSKFLVMVGLILLMEFLKNFWLVLLISAHLIFDLKSVINKM